MRIYFTKMKMCLDEDTDLSTVIINFLFYNRTQTVRSTDASRRIWAAGVDVRNGAVPPTKKTTAETFYFEIECTL